MRTRLDPFAVVRRTKGLENFAQEPVGFTAKRLEGSAQGWRLCGTLGIGKKNRVALTKDATLERLVRAARV
jgi:hypothetical protein